MVSIITLALLALLILITLLKNILLTKISEKAFFITKTIILITNIPFFILHFLPVFYEMPIAIIALAFTYAGIYQGSLPTVFFSFAIYIYLITVENPNLRSGGSVFALILIILGIVSLKRKRLNTRDKNTKNKSEPK